MENLQVRASAADSVFIKEFPHQVAHIYNDVFLDHFTYSFLIRDPAKTLPSMYGKWQDFELSEIGFAEQRTLFDRITGHNEFPPPVIDVEELVADPAGVVPTWSDGVGLPFLAHALYWDAPSEETHSWHDEGS